MASQSEQAKRFRAVQSEPKDTRRWVVRTGQTVFLPGMKAPRIEPYRDGLIDQALRLGTFAGLAPLTNRERSEVLAAMSAGKAA
jgi:hypothetical protein